MTSGQKIAFSVIAALALFAGFVLSFQSSLFSELETRFYTQAKIEENTGQLDKISESCDSYISEILSLVEKGENAWAKNASVRTYYVQNPSESDVNIRRRLTENLFAQIPALTGIRIVDKNGKNVHYSSFDDTDLLKQNGITKIYKNYNDITKDAAEIPFETLTKLTDETKSVLLCDQGRGRLILSVPFCWVDGIYSGLCLFYLNMHEVENALTSRGVISIGQGITLFSDDDYNGGFILNVPFSNRNEFKEPTLGYWKSGSRQLEKLLELPDGRFYVALSSNRVGKIRVSAVFTSDIFELSPEIRLLIYICVFITILLIVFLFFSFFRDPVATLQKRIKKIQMGIIENYLDGKEKKEWSDLSRQLRLRRNDLSDEIIRSLHVHSKKRRKVLSDYLDKNWEDIFAIFETKTREGGSGESSSVKNAEISGASIAEIRRMLEEVLQNRSLVAPAAASVQKVAAKVDEVEELAEDVDEVEELVEDAEDVDEVEELVEDAEDVEEVEELDEEVEDLDDAEEVVEEAEEVVEDAEEVVEEAEEVVEDAEEEVVDEVEELDEEVDELDDAEEVVDELDDAEEEVVEDLDDAEEVDELEDAEEVVDELDDAEEEIDELEEEVEDLDDAEDDEIEVLEEYVEPKTSEFDIDAFFKSIAAPKIEYKPSNTTYFPTENFAHVENLFAEELCLGDDHLPIHTTSFEIEIYPLPEYDLDAPVSEENLPFADEPTQVVDDDTPVEELDDEPLADVDDFIDADIIEDDPILPTHHQPPVEEEVVEPIETVEEISDEIVEDLGEEVPLLADEPDFSMTRFADNIDAEVPELESALTIPVAPENTIVEKDGVFSISDNLEYTNIVQDPDFKELVDSIL